MFSPIRKPISGRDSPALSISVLPNDLVIEILTRLSGKQVGRCKCVCKPWRTMIGSLSFSVTYRERQRGRLLSWSKRINQDDGVPVLRVRFFHCPLRRLEEPREDFSPLRELELEIGGGSRGLRGVTQLVNGLLCIGEGDASGSNFRLTIHSICTGEMMRVPNPLPCVDTVSTYHLGYDPVSKLYKLLRLKLRKKRISGAHIMTLRPPTRSLSTWRELDYNAAGICDLHPVDTTRLSEVMTSPDDGMLCWMKSLKDNRLLYFDLNRERFELIDYPEPEVGMRISAMTRFMDSLALCLVSLRDYLSGMSCYVQENNDEGKNWSINHVDILKEFKESEGFTLASESCLSFPSSGEMLVRNPNQSWPVYPYSRQHIQHSDKDGVFIVGKLPDGAPVLDMISLPHRWKRCFQKSCDFDIFCFMEGNNMYLALDDVFGGGGMLLCN